MFERTAEVLERVAAKLSGSDRPAALHKNTRGTRTPSSRIAGAFRQGSAT